MKNKVTKEVLTQKMVATFKKRLERKGLTVHEVDDTLFIRNANGVEVAFCKLSDFEILARSLLS